MSILPLETVHNIIIRASAKEFNLIKPAFADHQEVPGDHTCARVAVVQFVFAIRLSLRFSSMRLSVIQLP